MFIIIVIISDKNPPENLFVKNLINFNEWLMNDFFWNYLKLFTMFLFGFKTFLLLSGSDVGVFKANNQLLYFQA